MNVYATIDELKTFLAGGLEEGIAEDDDDLFKRFCIVASRAFDTWVTNGVSPKRRFYPTVATKVYDHPSSETLLRLNNDLLEATTLTTENTAITISSSDYVLKASTGDYNRTPYSQVQLVEDGTTTTYSFNGSRYKSNALTGIWGYHDEWADAWEDSGDTVQDSPSINSTVTTVTVTDADGDDINGLTRRFKIQQLLKIEDEFIWVTDVNINDNTLTVRRGMNGSTAATHLQNVAISIFRPMDEIRHAIETLATYLYQRRSSIGTESDRPLATMEGVLVMPSMIPEEVKSILRPYRKERL